MGLYRQVSSASLVAQRCATCVWLYDGVICGLSFASGERMLWLTPTSKWDILACNFFFRGSYCLLNLLQYKLISLGEFSHKQELVFS